MEKKPIGIPEHTCFIATLTLSGELTTFHSMIPTIHQAILIGFKRIYIPPIEISLFAQAACVELIRMPDMPFLLSHLGKKTSLFDDDLILLQPEILYEDTEKIPHACFSAIRGHEDAKRAWRAATTY